MKLPSGKRETWKLAVAGCLIVGACLVTAQQRQLMGKLKGFSISPEFYPAPHASQMKSFLQGTEAEPLPGGKVKVTNARLQTFREDGTGELLVTAPNCDYDTKAKIANSGGPLKAQSVDGRFEMSGVGFAWEQPVSRLSISNEVHTVLQLEALSEEDVTAPAKTNRHPHAAPSSGTPSTLDVKAGQFVYDANSGLGTYSTAVQVTGTNLAIGAEKLQFKLPMNERKLRTINAEKNVSLEYSGIKATGQTADYATDTGILSVKGNPQWFADTRQGKARELIIERTNRTFRALGDAWLEMQGQSLGNYSFLPSGVTNLNVAQATNQHLEVHSASYEFHTNFASFQKQVRVEQFAAGKPQGWLTCSEMDVFFSSTNSLDLIRARGGVAIVQAENRFEAGEANYAGTNGILALTQSPSWKSGDRDGKGDVINVNTERQEMLVQGHAQMRLPTAELGDVSILGAPETNTVKKAPTKARTTDSAPQMAVITSEDYRLSRQAAVFNGKVAIDHPQMKMECGRLQVAMPPKGKQVESIVAEETVRFDLVDGKGQKLHGRANKAVYTYSVTPTETNDLLVLTGYPVLETPEVTLSQSELIVFDRAKGKVVATDSFRSTGQVAGPTNRFRFPGDK